MAGLQVSSHSSDLSQAVINLVKRSDLIGYRNVLSYAAALDLQIFHRDAVEREPWEGLGTGSYSTTYRGTLHQSGKKDLIVAIKQPNGSFTRDKPEVGDRVQHMALSSIIQELRILADPKLKCHPNLPHILGAYFQEEKFPLGIRPCIIFDLAVSDFKEFLHARSPGRGDAMDLVKACAQIASGLCALHAYGLVHGDIKPENVLMFERGGELVAAVSDLGTCGVESQAEIITGTQPFWAPEFHLESPFHPSVNRSPRDVYSFGLVAFAAAIWHREHPFPNLTFEQFKLQHNDELCLNRLLSKMSEESNFDAVLREIVRLCVRSNPEARPPIFKVARMLEESLGGGREREEVQDIAESALLFNPNTPRVNILGQMPLPDYLKNKLQAEFTILAQDSPSIRTALTISAFYGGILGPGIEWPWDLIAKTQWLLKAVELGSHAAISAALNQDVLAVLNRFGLQVFELRQPFFQPPEVDTELLYIRLKGFSKIGDEDVSSKLLRLMVNITGTESTGNELEDQSASTMDVTEQPKTHRSEKRDDFLKQFTITRVSDFNMLDSDAFDICFGGREDIVKSAYNDDLEAFIARAEEEGLSQGSERLHHCTSVAVMNGSLEVVRFIMEHFGEGPNNSWGGTTHLEDSIVFGRSKVAKFYLEKGAELMPTNPTQPSVLHYLPRYDNDELARTVCEKLGSQGNLRRVLNWMPTGGTYTGRGPLSVAVTTGAWKVSLLYIQLGADVNLEADTDRVLNVAMTPQSPSVPIVVLRNILSHGGDPNVFTENSHPALQWPVWSSNILAVRELLIHGAKPVLSEEYDFYQFAAEILTMRREETPVDVVDEDGKVVDDSWILAVEASKLVLDMMTLARDEKPGWDAQIKESVESASKACLGKYWMVVGEGPTMGAIEVKIPIDV